MNQNAEVFGAVLRAIIPTRRDLIIGGVVSATVFGLAVYGVLHLAGIA
jgi:hypothetical protein